MPDFLFCFGFNFKMAMTIGDPTTFSVMASNLNVRD
jgi:hypothetical protein